MNTATADTDSVQSFAQCHEGIVAHLVALKELPELLRPAARARQVAQDTLDFFHEAVFDHHKEEEKDLFTAVLAHATAGDEREDVQRMVTELSAEHRRIEAMWRALQPQLEQVATGSSVSCDSEDLNALVRTYMAHANWEETRFLPLAQTILGRHSEDLAALGLALHTRHVFKAARRGLRGS